MGEEEKTSYAVCLLTHEVVLLPERVKVSLGEGDWLRAGKGDLVAVKEIGYGLALEMLIFGRDGDGDVL